MNQLLSSVISCISIVFLSLLLFENCGNIESEKAYCEKKAQQYFLLCLINIKTAPSYFGKPEWTSPQIQTYSQNFCVAEYIRKKRCADQKEYRPHRKD